MKRFILLALMVIPQAYSQCTDVFTIPYTMDIESVTAPNLAECSLSGYNSFSSQEVFNTVAGPVEGYTGNVLAYSTAITSEFIPPQSPVSAALYSPYLQLEQGVNYQLSYKFGNNVPDLAISNLYVSLSRNNAPQIEIMQYTDITGATPVVALIPLTVQESGNYLLTFTVSSEGSQGIFYLDDVEITEAPTMSAPTFHRSAINKIYPNPVADIVWLNNDSFIEDVSITNTAGQVVYSEKLLKPLSQINMSTMPAGVYFLSIFSSGTNENIKLIKK